jgi:hypothetical protein
MTSNPNPKLHADTDDFNLVLALIMWRPLILKGNIMELSSWMLHDSILNEFTYQDPLHFTIAYYKMLAPWLMLITTVNVLYSSSAVALW